MATKSIIIKGRYYDSVSLMNVARQVNGLPGITESAVVMGTAANKDILRGSGIYLAEFEDTSDADLLIAVKSEDETLLEPALAEVQRILDSLRKKVDDGKGVSRPRSLEAAVEALPGANMAMISVAGQYAGDLTLKALQHGMHVLLFSDNVSLEREVALKQFAHEKGLLVMGPDCGTAIINGAPLAFANVVTRGPIGCVAAAGTGLQEVTCLISNHGGGISQAIGTGGRDIKKEVGGITFIDGLRALVQDEATKVIVLVSKPPHPEVMEKIGREVTGVAKPVVAVFLGADPEVVRGMGMTPATTLEEASLEAVRLARVLETLAEDRDAAKAHGTADVPPADVAPRAAEMEKRLQPFQKYVRGLFSGGTFCYEAQLLLKGGVDEVWSNTPAKGVKTLPDAHQSIGHTVVDLGDDQFTVGKPHPMIDFSTRNKRILAEAADPETAVILLDLVLGYGSNLTPLPDLVPTLAEALAIAEKHARYLPIVCSVTGTDEDPQHRGQVVKALQEIGVVVERSNAAACALAAALVSTRKAGEVHA